MPDILTRNVPAKIHAELKKLADKKGESVQQLNLKAIEKYLELSKIEERLEKILQRNGQNIKSGEIQKILDEERSKRP